MTIESVWGPQSIRHEFGMAGVFALKFPLLAKAAQLLIWPFSFAALAQCIRNFATGGRWGQDAHAYWAAVQGPLEYGTAPGREDAFLYSPIFADVIRPLGQLPWPAFCTVWVLIEAAALVWLVKPLPLRWAVPVFITSLPELVVGNIYLLLAMSVVLGLRVPGVWAFPILTKVTTGVGLVWYIARRDWKGLLVGISATALIVLVSCIFGPQAWRQWIEFLAANQTHTPDSTLSFIIRCTIAVLLTYVAARPGWAFLVPIAVMLATPVLVWPIPLMVLTAIPRILLMEGRASICLSANTPHR
ncbi:glycosyltransferase family 87 protein [Sinomonas soli]